ncbi:MAG: hypothetical protein LBG27_03730 [Spirochaetaceae bacterium]|jgi:hypothetical protein|nr:hypothetical protein [Spirochaetaceae bacterium]
MSYTQRFHESITFSGSKTVSYPKSDSGGSTSVHYSETVPVDITIYVETEPFDNSVTRVNRNLDVLTGSVVAMNAAQVAAIQKTAQEVSASLIDGFFGTINQELIQQLQQLDSAIKAGFGLLEEQGKAVSAQKDTMETDYNRISSRYTALFQDLDNECHKRVYALDKSAFVLSDMLKTFLIGANTDACAKNLLGIGDESGSKNVLLTSRLKRIMLEVFKTLSQYVTQEERMSALIDSFLVDRNIGEKETVYIPVVWTESDSLEQGTCDRNSYIPDFVDDARRAGIQEKTAAYCAVATDWKAVSSGERDAIDKEFKSIAEAEFGGSADEKSARVYGKLMELWQNAETRVFS